jgi:hypothetical protein
MSSTLKRTLDNNLREEIRDLAVQNVPHSNIAS